MADTADTAEILLRMVEENWTHVRHSEDQRATITNLLIIVVSVIQGILTQTGFTKNILPLTLLLIILGLYGIIATAKLHERSQMHINRARKLRHRLDELCPEAQVQVLQNEADEEILKEYPILTGKIHLSLLWPTLHGFVALLGAIYTVIIVIR
jgi:hypothetical protein